MDSQSNCIPFIIKNQNAQYQITNKAAEFLSAITTPFSIVTTAGLYRTGKSYLLNRVILNRSDGFGVGPTVNACTKGLWIWGQVIHAENNNLIVIDTEGLGALDEDANHDMKIVCLAVLLSTTFIYNSVGSIDQNALQTLSLVLNLVNTIDQQSLSMKPELIWVVRDFSLQLINEKGESITSSQYLELALATSSKQLSKTQVRNTILNSFKQRDCFTLVKPLIDENKLQHLDQISMDELRGEFVSQCMKLRKQIMSSLKPLTICNSKPLNGIDYVRMVSKYIKVINEGSVPNISDTWTYIKQEKAREVVTDLQKIYGEKLKTKITNKMPLPISQLQEIISQLQKQIFEDFKKLTYEGTSSLLITDLVSGWKTFIERSNFQCTKSTLNGLLNKQHLPFHKKLYSAYYQNYDQFVEELNINFKRYFLDKYQDKYDLVEQSLQKFVQTKLIEGFRIFDKQNKEEIKQSRRVKEELQTKFYSEVQQQKRQSEQSTKVLEEKISRLQESILSLSEQKQYEKRLFEQQKISSNKTIEYLNRKQQELLQVVERLNKDVMVKNSHQIQMQQDVYMKEKQIEKQKALFTQRQLYLQTQLTQYQRKCRVAEAELKRIQGNAESDKKNLVQFHEQKIKLLTIQNKCLLEKTSQMEYLIQNSNSQIQRLNQSIKTITQKKSEQLKSVKDKLSLHQANFQNQNQINVNSFQKEYDKLKEESMISNSLIRQFEAKNKQLYDQFKSLKNNSEKQIAIHKQKIQFQQIQINELRSSYEDLKNNYQRATENIHDNSKNLQENLQIKLFQKENQYQMKYKQLEIEFEDKIKDIKKQLINMAKLKEELQLQIILSQKNFEEKERQWKQNIIGFQNLNKKTQERLIQSEKQHQNAFKEKQNYFKLRMKQLETQLDIIKQKSAKEINQIQEKSEESLIILKKYSQMEKIQWQKRLTDEKEKSEKKLRCLNEQYQQKFAQQKQLFQEENNQLQQKINQIHRIFNQKIQNMQYDHDISLQKTVNQFMDEKVQLNKNFALVQQQLNLTKQNLQNQIQDVRKTGQKNIQGSKRTLINQYQQIIAKITDQKNHIEARHESLKKANRQTEQSNLVLKNQIQKQKAIYKQKQYYYEKKISEIQNCLQLQLKSYNQTIQKLSETHVTERSNLNKQIEKLKQANFNLEEEKNKCISDFETEKNLSMARINFTQTQWKRSKEDYADILKKFQTTVKHLSLERENIKSQNDISRNQIIITIKDQFQRQIYELKQSHARMLKDSEDRVSRLQTQNKSLRDRIALIELKPQNSSFLNNRQVEKLKQQYEQKIFHYQKALQKQRRQNRQNSVLKQQYERKMSDRSFLDRSERVSLNESNISSTKYKEGKNVLGNKFSNSPLISKKNPGRTIDNDDFCGIKKYKN